MLAEFDGQTRMPGSSLHNSLAAVQKWEHLGDADWRTSDPQAEAERMCARMQEQLADKVSAVVPTSGLLGRAVAVVGEQVWQAVAQLANAAGDDDFELLTDDADLFVDQDATFERVSLPQIERVALQQQLPWPALRLALRQSRRLQLRDGEELRRHLRELSGLDRLAHLLHERFFRQAGLIQATTAPAGSASTISLASDPILTYAAKLVSAVAALSGGLTKNSDGIAYSSPRPSRISRALPRASSRNAALVRVVPKSMASISSFEPTGGAIAGGSVGHVEGRGKGLGNRHKPALLRFQPLIRCLNLQRGPPQEVPCVPTDEHPTVRTRGLGDSQHDGIAKCHLGGDALHQVANGRQRQRQIRVEMGQDPESVVRTKCRDQAAQLVGR